jgi:hypothetical protein
VQSHEGNAAAGLSNLTYLRHNEVLENRYHHLLCKYPELSKLHTLSCNTVSTAFAVFVLGIFRVSFTEGQVECPPMLEKLGRERTRMSKKSRHIRLKETAIKKYAKLISAIL